MYSKFTGESWFGVNDQPLKKEYFTLLESNVMSILNEENLRVSWPKRLWDALFGDPSRASRTQHRAHDAAQDTIAATRRAETQAMALQKGHQRELAAFAAAQKKILMNTTDAAGQPLRDVVKDVDPHRLANDLAAAIKKSDASTLPVRQRDAPFTVGGGVQAVTLYGRVFNIGLGKFKLKRLSESFTKKASDVIALQRSNQAMFTSLRKAASRYPKDVTSIQKALKQTVGTGIAAVTASIGAGYALLRHAINKVTTVITNSQQPSPDELAYAEFWNNLSKNLEEFKKVGIPVGIAIGIILVGTKILGALDDEEEEDERLATEEITVDPGPTDTEGFPKPGTSDSWVSRQTPMDWTQHTLLAAGMTPGIGFIFDLLSAGLYTVTGQFTDAGVSAAAAIPIFGQGTTVARWAHQGNKLQQTIAKVSVKKGLFGQGPDLMRYRFPLEAGASMTAMSLASDSIERILGKGDPSPNLPSQPEIAAKLNALPPTPETPDSKLLLNLAQGLPKYATLLLAALLGYKVMQLINSHREREEPENV